MGFDQKGTVELKVCHGANGRWDVNESGFEKPLATFDSKEDACSYAEDLAKTKDGSKVSVED